MASPLPLHRMVLRRAALLGALTLSAPAFAQDIATAKALFNRGVADMKAGKYETGCEAIAESHRLDPHPGTLFTLAMCERKWGRIATAATRYDAYLALYKSLPADQKASQAARAKEAAAQLEALGPEVPQLSLELLPGAPSGTVIKRDGMILAQAALGMELPVDPGEHVVTTQAPGGPVWEQRISLERREKKNLLLEVKPPAPRGSAPPTARPPEDKATPLPPRAAPPAPEGPLVTARPAGGPSGRRVGAYVIGGVGAAGLVVGGVMGALTLQRKGVIDANCKDRVNMPALCNETGFNAMTSGKALAIGSNVGFVAGALSLGTAAALLLTETTTEKPASGARGRWVSAGVLEADPRGAVLGVRGTW